MKSDRIYLEQIVESVNKIKNFAEGFDQEKFMSDQKTQSAVIMQMALIGELAKKIAEETKSQIILPWKDITGFRDRAIHDYYQIDLEIVWTTIFSDLDIVGARIKEFLV